MGFVFNILSIFPELVKNFTDYSLIKKAIEKGILEFNFINLRNFTNDKHKQIDDEPYGGGSGMVFKIEPVYNALCSLKDNKKGKIILLSAKGKKFSQELANKLSKENSLTLICGRYEGIDERITNFIDYEVSIGDYVVMGGEVGACVLIEAVARLIPGVVGEENSVKDESFQDIFLEYPQYTRPAEFKGLKVPEILLSGNHKEIDNWRKLKKIEITLKNRFDLIKERKRVLIKEEIDQISVFLNKKYNVFLALIHYPVYNKKGKIVSTAITNMDIHDISRLSKTYGLKKYFIVTPDEEQKAYAQRIIDHWKYGYGKEFNPTRKEALEVIEILSSFDEVVSYIKSSIKKELICVGTSAKQYGNQITFSSLRDLMNNYAVLIVLGTGWGLTEDIKNKMDFMLEPIYGLSDFNHLSVRSAASIIIDRLLGF